MGEECLYWFREQKKLPLLAGILILASTLYFGLPLLKFALKNHAFQSSRIELDDPGKRILVIAPHPDDETLAAAGIIQRALQEGASVKIVVVTSGNHFVKAARLLTRKKALGPGDFAYLGRVREKECLEALKVLGVNRSDVAFLQYPDRGLSLLWKRFNEKKHPRDARGEQMAMLFKEIIGSYRPTDIYYPYDRDEHADHKGVNGFINNALKSSHQRVRQHLYLVHYEKNNWPYFPRLSRFLPLIPPYDLIKKGIVWEVFTLRPGEVQKKDLAVRQYRSQLNATRGRYLIFVRPEEIFVSPGR